MGRSGPSACTTAATGHNSNRTATGSCATANRFLLDGFYYLNFKLKLKHPPGFAPGPGVGDDRFYAFLQQTWMAHQIPIAIVLYLLDGWPWVVWGVCVRIAARTLMHWYISYFVYTRRARRIGPSTTP